MNKDDFTRLQQILLWKIGVTGGWIDKIDGDGVYLYLTWGAVKKLRASKPKVKSCYNCDFWTPKNEKRCSNWEALYEAPFETRDPPRALVIVEKGCELFQSSESTERNEE